MSNNKFNRRTFIQSSAALGAGLFLSSGNLVRGASAGKIGKNDSLNIALLGCGAQGQVLLSSILKIKGVRVMAVCDIWEKYNLRRVSRTVAAYKKYGHVGTPYVDYKEMLDKETDLDAVIIATPDFWHAEHTIACLEKGLHVYCEKEMSNTLEGARKMLEASRRTGKLLQIGHQRRSNPRYRHCYDKLIKEASLLGNITTINGQWNRSKAACEDLAWPDNAAISEGVLNKFGFESMAQFRNWRWYKGLGGGPIVDLGSHQIDIYSWFLGSNPRSVIASGGTDYWKDHQWYDNVMAIYEYDTPAGIVRASYQTLTTNSNGGYFETFMGDEGTLTISEAAKCGVYREAYVADTEWEKWVKAGYIKIPEAIAADSDAAKTGIDSRSTIPAALYEMPVELNDPPHMPHLKNFFNAVRGKEQLNCPAEAGYETAVTVLKVNEAVKQQRRLEFTKEEFAV